MTSGKFRIKNLVVDHSAIVNGADITEAAAEMAALDGLTASAAELNFNDGSVAGTAVASKTVVLDSSKGVVGLGVVSVGTSNTSGVVLTSSITNALQVVAEDNGVTIASGNPKAIKGRLFIKANPGDCTLDGILGQVKFNTSITASADYQSGIRGYAELVGGNTVNTGGANANAGSGVYGLRGYITVDDDLTIAASHYIVGCGVQLSVKAAKSVTATGTLAAFGAFADDQAGGATATQKWGVGLYMPSGTVVKAIDATCDAIGATGRIAKLYGSSANAAFTDGYGSVEIDLTLTGTVASTVAASSTWINMGASSSGGSELICVQNNGIYVPSAGTPMASATAIIGMRMQYVTEGGENPGALYLFSTNINANAVTALFHVNAAVDLSWTTGAKSTNAGSIPLFRDVTAGKTWYVNVYDG